MNLIVEDRTTWLTNIQTQLVSNLEKNQKIYEENVNEHHKD